jgi:hypothetical protein
MTVYRYKNYLVRISTTKRVLTGFSTKIKIKKITEHIKNISELKCNIELECMCLWNFICAQARSRVRVSIKYCVDTQYTAKVKNLWNKFAQPMISLNWSWIIIYYLHFTPFSCYFLDLRISFPGLCSRMIYVLRKEIKMFFF